jgi:branched-chain amino acid transport system ATP-binding protein
MGIQEKGNKKRTVDRVSEVFPMLRPLQKRKGMDLSGGGQQVLTIARTLIGDAELLLLDEPSEGLAPVIVKKVARLLKEIREDITSVQLIFK